MDINRVQKLVDMMKANDLSELGIVDGQTRIVLKRTDATAIQQVVAMPPVLGAGVQQASQIAPIAPAQPVEDEKFLTIDSPIVGTFYSTASPDNDPFVEVDTKVNQDTVVCIIEAMKVMNEIKSEIAGTVKKVLVQNGEAVEFGQPLFLVEPE